MIDHLIIQFDRGLRTLFGEPTSVRQTPGADLPEHELSDDERRHAAGLMRVNHCGEICAQALYQGQALTSRDDAIRESLVRAAQEETEHLAWTEQRIGELGGRKSLLNPVWYLGSLGLGVLAGRLGDRVNLGFLAETERQVEQHLSDHLDRLPQADQRSRAIVEQMRSDEAEHAATAVQLGAADFPAPVRKAMQLASKVMTRTAYWV
ncbi:MAG: 2-polyprenyl-3-methyl-6-methoxy-1,4-benzoquinone monooxygenase [Rhodocyclaceae bacterium]|nr:2-polyprenyl-3-methyl-6-methoxy-1,4-benzoquinone monooxygenase [Rhodocyclaceae bacterium]